MMMESIAHIRVDENGEQIIQTVRDHSLGTARIARESTGGTMPHVAYLAGLLHDMGKCTQEFTDYIADAATGEDVTLRKVIHSFTGAKYALERWHSPGTDNISLMTAEIIAYSIASHHGLMDCLDEYGKSGFQRRLEFDSDKYDEAVTRFENEVASGQEMDLLFSLARNEVEDMAKLDDMRRKAVFGQKDNIHFIFGMFARLVLSAVINGDRHDTASFMDTENYVAAVSPVKDEWKAMAKAVERRIHFIPSRSRLDVYRKAFSDESARFDRCSGIFRLNLPTGGGKTLTSLRLALNLASKGHRRIVYTIPLLSILEQNALAIRNIMDADEWILEHHSNVVQDKSDTESFGKSQLLRESWDSPVVITTLVQFLDTLFSSKTSCVRRFSALSNSVIVIDEVQSAPRKLLSLLNMALNHLAYWCNCAIVLCSATQPCLDQVENGRHGIVLSDLPDIVRFDKCTWEAFTRTRIVDECTQYGHTLEDVARRGIGLASSSGSTLIVCNTKSEALQLYRLIKPAWHGQLIHLSTSMCMAHRKHTLSRLNRALNSNESLICVSTQLIEAGVDVSFSSVIRVSAGLDNIVQAAGRCNRNGEKDGLGEVVIMNIRNEMLRGLPDIVDGQRALLQTSIARGDATYDSPECLEKYYHFLYRGMVPGTTEYPSLKHKPATLFDMLAINTAFQGQASTDKCYMLRQAFRTAGDEFRVFDDDRIDVIVPYGEDGKRLINDLCGLDENELTKAGILIRKAAQYTVSLFRHQVEKLDREGGIISIRDGEILFLATGLYDNDVGVTSMNIENGYLEV